MTVSADLSANIIAERAGKVASWVLSAFKTRDKATMMTLYKSLVRSHLESSVELFYDKGHPTARRDAAYVYIENRWYPAPQLLAEIKGPRSDVIAKKKGTVFNHLHDVESSALQVP